MSEPLKDYSPYELDIMCTKSVQEFGKRLRKLLDERNLSMGHFASATGLGASSLRKYLRGDATRFPLVSVVVRCSIVLGVSTDYLLGLCDDDGIAAACSNNACHEDSAVKICDVSSSLAA